MTAFLAPNSIRYRTLSIQLVPVAFSGVTFSKLAILLRSHLRKDFRHRLVRPPSFNRVLEQRLQMMETKITHDFHV